MIRKFIESLLGREIGQDNGTIDLRSLYKPSVVFYGFTQGGAEQALPQHTQDVVYLVTKEREVHKRQGDTWIYLGQAKA